MSASLTAKKQSDLRVAALRGAVGSAAAPMSPVPVRARAEELAARLGGIADRIPAAAAAGDAPVLADVVALFELPELAVDGVTALVDGKGRIACVAARTVLGWEPQDLSADREGHWVVLRPAGTRSASRCTPRLGAGDKITLPAAQRRLLGVRPGRRVYVQPIPGAGALGLLNPAAVLLGAPLSLLAAGGEERA